MTNPPPTPSLGLPELLLVATRVVFERVHDRLAAEGFPVRPAHGYTFQLLANTGGASGAELAEHLGVTKQAAAQLLDGLEQAGYITRQSDPRNHRSRLAVLTDRGWSCIRAATAAWQDAEAAAADLLGADRVQALREDLTRLATDAGALQPPLRLRPVW